MTAWSSSRLQEKIEDEEATDWRFLFLLHIILICYEFILGIHVSQWIGENRPLVADELVEFEKWPVRAHQDFREKLRTRRSLTEVFFFFCILYWYARSLSRAYTCPNEWGEPTASCRWTRSVWEMTGWSSWRLQGKIEVEEASIVNQVHSTAFTKVPLMPTWMRSIFFRSMELGFMRWRLVIAYFHDSFEICCSQKVFPNALFICFNRVSLHQIETLTPTLGSIQLKSKQWRYTMLSLCIHQFL